MNLCRRSFVGGAFAAGILSGCQSPVVRVRPFDCWGNRGKEIVSEPVVMARK